MDIHKIVEATLRVTEDEMVQASEPMVEEPMVDEPAGSGERPEITPELIAQLVEQNPELGEVEQEKLINGINVEMEHFETVGGDVAVIAKIAFDHMKEFPMADYYAALAQMESELAETPEEEMAEEGVPGDEIPAGEEATQTPKSSSPFESKKDEKSQE